VSFESGDYVIRKAAPEFIWKVVGRSRTNKNGLPAFNKNERFLTLTPVCTVDGKPPLSNVKQQTWSWNCEPANAMLVIAYEASRA
jgi:hypothetical protein